VGRRLIETQLADKDGRRWDDPVLPWRFVDQVDSGFAQSVVALGLVATVDEGRRLSRKVRTAEHS
jgi:hypothetical protein